MQLQNSSRKNVKIRIGLQGISGSGKTYSSLLLAYGLCGDWQKIGLIDSENLSSQFYSHLGNFQVLPLSAPFTPERYIEAIEICEKAGIEVIIIDSISHEWSGMGGILSVHSSKPGNSFTNWNKLSQRHYAMIEKILQSPAHVICTIRSKANYILTEKDGKQVPEKVGMKPITREGFDYELTVVFELNMKNAATVSKDRTCLFAGQPEFVISTKTGNMISDWCDSPDKGNDELPKEDLLVRINNCKSLGELLALYNSSAIVDQSNPEFTKKRQELKPVKTNLQTQNFSANGSTKIK